MCNFSLNNHISIEKQGTAHIGVFSFMPLKEIPSGLNYLIQGDYITTAGRADLARENKWNEWISTEIFNLIIVNDKFTKYLDNETIVKKIYVPNRLVNFVLK